MNLWDELNNSEPKLSLHCVLTASLLSSSNVYCNCWGAWQGNFLLISVSNSACSEYNQSLTAVVHCSISAPAPSLGACSFACSAVHDTLLPSWFRGTGAQVALQHSLIQRHLHGFFAQTCVFKEWKFMSLASRSFPRIFAKRFLILCLFGWDCR